MINADRSPTFFRFDPAEQLQLYKQMDERGRGDRRRLPLPHRDRGLPVADRRLPRRGAAGPLRAGLHGRVGQRRRTGRVCARTGSSTATSPRRRSRSRNSPAVAGALQLDASTGRRRRRAQMAVEVRIPTILRTFTGGEKAVQGDGATLLAGHRRRRGPPSRSQGAAGRGRTGCAGSSTSTSTTRTSGSAAASRPRPPTATSSSCCRPSRAAERPVVTRYASLADSVGHTPLVGLPTAVAERGRTALGQAGGPQPDRFDQGPRGAGHDPRGRGRRDAAAGRHDPRADQRQHRDLAGHGGQARAATG